MYTRITVIPRHYNARPLNSPAAVADDRQLHRLQRVTALQLPRKDPIWNPDPPARTPLLLCYPWPHSTTSIFSFAPG